jgi:nucleotide-binding universal stress UspA family protein
MGSVLLGSVSMPVLHHAPCSVLVTHRAPTGSDKVVLGVDGSRGSTDALHLAAGILDPARCSILVASVAPYPPIPLVVPYPGGTYVGHSRHYDRLEKERIERARNLAEKAASYLRKNGFDAEAVVLEGSPGPQLLKEADGSNADLVVVGSRGVGALHRALLGSVSDQVARHAPATLIGRPQRLISKG